MIKGGKLMKKKAVSLLLVLTVVTASLTACGSSSSTSTNSTSQSDSTTESSDSTYTYSYATASPSTWSPTDWQSSNEFTITNYTATLFYDYLMNEDKDGYVIEPAAAASMPVDVTADYAGNEIYGVPADATEGYAWTVELNPDLCWEDGTPITADTFIYSAKQYLNPDMSNYRAAILYNQLPLANAKSYYNSNKAGEVGFINSLGDLGYNTIEEAQADGYTEFGINMDEFWGLSGVGVVAIEDETLYGDGDYATTTQQAYDDYLAPGMSYSEWTYYYVYVGETVEAATWDEVGIIKNDDYSLTFILSTPLSEFYFINNLDSFIAVNEDLYEANKKQTGDITKSSYGTSVDKYMSYGPYKLVSFQEDKELTLTKNENWFGYSSDVFEGMYQTTDIVEEYISEYSTILSLFLQGNLSYTSISSEDMTKYGNSDYAYYTPSGFAYYYEFNSDLDSLSSRNSEGENHSILAYTDFRHAISLSVDRSDFVSTFYPASEVCFGLLSSVYIYDPDTGETYRNSEAAKEALSKAYGTSDIDQFTGYDKEAASELFQSAYEQCLADGNISENDTVVINFHQYGSDGTYIKLLNFLQESIDAATVGTDLEGRVRVDLIEDQDYSSSLQNGIADMICYSWGGSDLDPYAMMECWCSDTLLREYGFDPYTVTATINVNGSDVTMTLNEWFEELYNGTYATADSDTRNTILAGMEGTIISEYIAVPLYDLNTAGMYSLRTVLGSDEYINSIIGYGGIAYITYTMDDAEWDEYCAENNYQLEY
jgi:oligopeptide transport system substrate-binding protein